MDDSDINGRISELVDEEHQLRDRAAQHGGLTQEQRDRLQHLEERLDQCWDLLRQRRAREEAGQEPGQAEIRPVREVESYRQ